MTIFELPVKEILGVTLLLLAALFAVRGTRRLARGLRDAASIDVIRGIRGWVIAGAMAAFATGVLTSTSGFLVLGAVFLAEELYETGVVTLILRSSDR